MIKKESMARVGVGYRLASDGTALALDWDQPDGTKVTTYLPIDGIPITVGILLSAAANAAERAPAPSPSRPKLDRIMQPTDMQIITPDDGADWVLRIHFGHTHMDYELPSAHIHQFVEALQKSPQARRTAKKPDA